MSPVSAAPRSIALCLSGGGLRATLFHLGLIKALRAQPLGGGIALSAVTDIYSVSGGSIVAAHLVRNWADYVGGPADFEKAEKALLDFAARNVRDRVLRRGILAGWTGKGRAYWLQKEYDGLLGGATLGACAAAAGGGGPPRLHILATSFRTGQLCSFGPEYFEIERAGAPPARAYGQHLRLAFAVAASSAFPPLFPPVPLSNEDLRNPPDDEFQGTTHLSDGGVFDNLGFEKLRLCHGRAMPGPDLFIVSNAGAAFKTDPASRFLGPFSRNVRASDIMMRRVGDNTEAAASLLAQSSGATYVPVTIRDAIPVAAINPGTQQRLRAVRTDLDRFGPELGALLVDHGCAVGAAALRNAGFAAATLPAPLSAAWDGDRLDRVAARAARRRKRSFFLDFRDWTVWLLWLLAIALAALIVFETVSTYQKFEADRAARQAQSNKQTLAQYIRPIQQAYARGDEPALRVAIAKAMTIAEASRLDENLNIGSLKVDLSPGRVERIVESQAEAAAPGQAAAHPERVFIQFAGSLTRERIVALNRGLKEKGWLTQGASGERVASAAGLREVRYSGDNGKAAEELAAAITATGIVGEVTAKANPIIGANDLEVWISN